MVPPDVAARKIARASAWLDDAEPILSRPVDEFMAAAKDRDLAAFYLFLAIQESVDLAAHWVADAGWTVPDDAASTFDVLAQHDVIDRDLAAPCDSQPAFATESLMATPCWMTVESKRNRDPASSRFGGS